MILLAYSNKDTAGINIAKQLLTRLPFIKTEKIFQEEPIYKSEMADKHLSLVTLKEETVSSQDLPSHFTEVELLIYLSRHRSQSGKPTLSVHTPGNFGNAELGGLPKSLSICPATSMRDALLALLKFKTQADLDYDVSYECTHHGPSLKIPTMFVELGSSPKQWTDMEAAEVVAKAAIEAINKFQPNPSQPAALGIGGPHYNQHFTRMALNNEAIFGHMVPKYALQQVDTDMLQQCILATMEKVTHAILDWKGIPSQDKPKLLKALDHINLPYTKT
jgi:D-aminoacyl-tRNA deacylase